MISRVACVLAATAILTAPVAHTQPDCPPAPIAGVLEAATAGVREAHQYPDTYANYREIATEVLIALNNAGYRIVKVN